MLQLMKTPTWQRPREHWYDLRPLGPNLRRGFPGIPDPPYVREHDSVPITGSLIRSRLEGRTSAEQLANKNGVVSWSNVASLALRAATYCGDADVQSPLDRIEVLDPKGRSIGKFLLDRESETGLYTALSDVSGANYRPPAEFDAPESQQIDSYVEQSMAAGFNVRLHLGPSWPVIVHCDPAGVGPSWNEFLGNR